MTDSAIGLTLAIVGSVSFGAYILPRKLSRLSVLEYQWWLSLMVAPLSVLICLIAGAKLTGRFDLLLWSVACGPLWTLGSLSYSSAVDAIGVTRSTPVKNLAPVFASVYGILLFQEYSLQDPKSLALAVSGVLLMCLAAVIIGRAGAHDHERAFAFDVSLPAEKRRQYLWLGLVYSVGAAFFYGAYSIPLKYVFREGMSAYTACAWLGIGVLMSTFLIYMLKTGRVFPSYPGRREVHISQFAGAIWTSGQLLGALAMLYIPMSISWPVSNLSTLVAIAWGIWVFREVRLEEHRSDMILGVLVYLIGLVLLAIAAPSGHV